MTRKGDWIETYRGISFWPLDVQVNEIDLEDIAHSLSQQCRFNGHTKYFFSVAQHSLNVAALIRDVEKAGPKVQLMGLLHDASEAYICDIPRPVKPFLTNYMTIEDEVMNKIWEHFKLAPTSEELKIVKNYDNVCLAEEGCKLMPNLTHWAEKSLYGVDLRQKDILEVKQEFIAEVYRLLYAINHQGK